MPTKAEQEVADAILKNKDELSQSRAIFFTREGTLRFTNNYLDRVWQGQESNGISDSDVRPNESLSVPEEFKKIKTLASGGAIAGVAVVNQFNQLSEALAEKFRATVFGNGEHQAPHRVKKQDGLMLVSAWNKEGKVAFGKVCANPSVDWHRLVKSTIFAYTKGVDMTTGVISNYFINGKWVAFYEDDRLEEKYSRGMGFYE